MKMIGRKVSREILDIIMAELKHGKVDDFNNVPTPKKRSWRANISRYFKEFCHTTGIHGIRYLAEDARFLIEKIIWGILITVLCYFSISLVFKTYNKWLSSPVIVTFANRETSIWKIPFPAVTICPETKVDPTVFNYTDIYLKKLSGVDVTAEESRIFDSLALICLTYAQEDVCARCNFSWLAHEHVLDDIISVAPLANPDSFNVVWLGHRYPAYSLLSEIITGAGVCFVFNMVHPVELLVDHKGLTTNRIQSTITKSSYWSSETGYENNVILDTFPRRSFVAGVNGGLILKIYTNHTHLNYYCGDSQQGFKIALHHPNELPRMDQYFHLPLDQSVIVAVKPTMITISEELKYYDSIARKCFMDHESQLNFYKNYTQKNCLDECYANHTLLECGCVPFYMIKLPTSPICGPASKSCLLNSKVKYLATELNSNTSTMDCACFPSCRSLSYDVEISQSDWNWKKSPNGSQSNFDYNRDHFSKLTVFFKNIQFMSSVRHETFGLLDFFSSTGGLLGLFLGFSVTSAFEIVYFLTLRIACNIKKFGRMFWAGEEV